MIQRLIKKQNSSKNIIVKICFETDRLNTGRVGVKPDENYSETQYSKTIVLEWSTN